MLREKSFANVIIIGSGLAGMYTALSLNPRLTVILLSKESIFDNNSILAQGGIAACTKKEDDFSLHIEDTLRAGAKINDIKAVEALVKEAPGVIDRLINLGVEFDRDSSNEHKTTMEGGHSRRRILHSGGDATGKDIVRALSEKIRERSNILVAEDIMAIDLLMKDESCIGVKVLKGSKVIELFSEATVIATGGVGGVYTKSTNSHLATGDGIAIAYRAGCEIENMEFIQFHPTAFYSEKGGKKFLISEAVRGEGGILRNRFGERFMGKYDERLELAPRDIVSQSIYKEMESTGSNYVFLDITHREDKYLKERFPTIYKECLEHGINISKDLIPVSPVEHYCIGGVKVDLEGQTNIKNLYACGESSSTGVHGANRLASNSLLECGVFAGRISKRINTIIGKGRLMGMNNNEFNTLPNTESNMNILEIKAKIREIMSKFAGVVRWESGLLIAYDEINTLLSKLRSSVIIEREFLEALNMATVASLIIKASLLREKSIGCHYRIVEEKITKDRRSVTIA